MENIGFAVDTSRCSGCMACIVACNEMDPACVRTCPTHALKVGPLQAIATQHAEKASLVILKSLASCLNNRNVPA